MLDDILKYIENLSNKDIITILKDKYEEKDIEKQINIINNCYTKKQKTLKHKEENTLSSIILNISHDCNLNCIYCYGDGGNYGLKRKVMDLHTAKQSIDYWLDNLDINSRRLVVGFFGGEPLINKEIMLFSIEYINKRLKELNKTPMYIITTNGTILSEDILKAFKDNNFEVTISIDGTEEIHNKNRPFRDGIGSFSKIRENIRTLINNNISLNARITLTHENVESFYETVDYIWNLGIESVVYDIVTTKNSKLSLTEDDIKILENQLNKLTQITYESIVNKGHKVLLNIIQVSKILNNAKLGPKCSFNSSKNIMIDPDGDVYKCHRMQGKEVFKLGNIESNIKLVNNETNIECNQCWANNLCTKCAHTNYVMNNNEYMPYKLWCDCRKILYKESLRFYVKLLENHPRIFKDIYNK